MKSILITGGFGFLGSHLIDELIANGTNRITVIDNMSSNVVDPQDHSFDRGLVYYLDSVRNYLAGKTTRFNEIYHLASIVGPAGVLPHEGQIVKSIVDDAYAIANKAMDDGARLVFVSTSEVYGGGNDGLCSEDMDKRITAGVSARLEYAVGKLAAEIALINLSKSKGLDVVIVRPFNIAGPRQHAAGGFVLPRFINCALSGQPLTVFNSGQQVRALTHVQDVANGLYLAMQKGESQKIYNIGHEANKTSILDLAKRVVSLVDTESRVTNVDPTSIFGNNYVEANDKYPDSTRARKELGWQPTRNLGTIIRDTLDWTIAQASDKVREDKGEA